MKEINLFLFGEPRILINGEAYHFKRKLSEAILIYLSVNQEAISRGHLCQVFWPDHKNPREACRKALFNLRNELADALGEDWLAYDHQDTIDFDGAVAVASDIAEFLYAVEWYTPSDDLTTFNCNKYNTQLSRVIDYFREEFLDSFDIFHSIEPLNDWRTQMEAKFLQGFRKALHWLFECHYIRQEYQEALEYGRRYQETYPGDQDITLKLMKAYLELDKPASALQRYEITRQHLADELGISPDQELMTLANEIYDKNKATEASPFTLPPDDPEPIRDTQGNMNEITSRQNPKVKQIRALSQRKQRDTQELFVVEGIRHVGEAVESGAQVEYLMVAPDYLKSDYAQSLIENAEDNNIPIYSTTPELFSSLAEKEHPQGLLAVVRQNLTSLSELSPNNFPWGAAVISPQDPGNLGTLLRTLDAVGAGGLLILEGGVDVFHPSAVRASMGALFTKAVVKTSFEEFDSWAKGHSYKVYGSSAHGDTPYSQIDFENPAILLLGSEREGLTSEQAAACDHLLQIPMAGNTTSLNLSVAAGIILFEMRNKLDG